MSKSDYWDEREHEKYERMKVEVQLEDFDFEKAKKVSKITNRIIKIITIPAIVIGIATFILIFAIVILFWKGLNERLSPDIIGNLEEMYNEKFKIVSCETPDTRQEIYTLSPKSNKKIQFTAYRNGMATGDDFQSHTFKYFVENGLDENIRNKLTIEEQYYEVNGVNLFAYNAYLEPKNLAELDEYVEDMNAIRKKAEKEKRKVYSYITTKSWIRIQNYYSNVRYDNGEETEYLKKQEEYEFIEYAKENKMTSFEIPEEKLKNHKPKYLEVVLNGKNLKQEYLNAGFPATDTYEGFYNFHCKAIYNEMLEEYEFRISEIIEFLDDVEVEKDASNMVVSMKYKGKEYKIHDEDNEMKGEKIPDCCKIPYYEKYLGATIKYDYENELIYIDL